ncbi:MAG: DUF4381 domain-containing protein [Alphaproteobacteria bacterium]|nr:DUF4381 domain-containing protein [Alphaproteobacteria bacterium]
MDLSELRDIHLPTEPSWWPPAVGWWYLLGIIIGGLIVFGAGYMYWWTRPKQYAVRELEGICSNQKNAVLAARRISVLLKRIALLIYPRSKVATLSDEKWIDFLISKIGQVYSEAELNLLASAPYMPEDAVISVDSRLLCQNTRKAILKLFKRGKHEHKSRKHK